MTSSLKDLVKKNKKYVKEDFNLNELVDKFLLGEQNSSSHSHSSFFHPSLISKGVECQLWWFYYLKKKDAAPNKWTDESLTAMTVGTAIHNQFQSILYKMDMLEGLWKCLNCEHKFWALSPKDVCPNCGKQFKSWNYLEFKEVPIQTSFIRGHADGILNKDGQRFLLELKSIKNVDRAGAKYGYETLTARPMDEHFIQAQLYLHGWYEIAKKAPLEEEYVVDEVGKISTEKIAGPIYDGAKEVGVLNNAVIEYVAKNSSQKKSYNVKRSVASIQFLLDEMQLIWKAYLEDNIDLLVGTVEHSTTNCKKCVYRGVCGWS